MPAVSDNAVMEQRVFRVTLADGTNREIAALLGINERSAEGHVERIRTRLGVGSRTQVAAWFINHRDEQ